MGLLEKFNFLFNKRLIYQDKTKRTIHNQAEDGDRRPWLVFVLDNLPLKFIKATITYSRRKWDSDDVKVRIDGKIQTSFTPSIKHFFWKFIGSLLSWGSPTETQTKRFWPRLKKFL